MTFLKTGNSEIFYECEGEGTPVFLLAPGGMRSANSFWENMPWNPRESLVKDFKLIGMDQRNAGQSKAPISPSDDWNTYTNDQLAILDHLEIEKCHLLGMCIGGPFIAGLLQADPKRFLSAVMLQPVGIDDNRNALYEMFDSWADDAEVREKFLTPEAVSQFRSNMWDGEFLLSATKDNVRKFDTPLLLFMGDDLYHPQSISREIANIAPDVTFVEEWKNPESLNNTNETILSFLSKHS